MVELTQGGPSDAAPIPLPLEASRRVPGGDAQWDDPDDLIEDDLDEEIDAVDEPEDEEEIDDEEDLTDDVEEEEDDYDRDRSLAELEDEEEQLDDPEEWDS